ncbi:hypothetical protein AS27_07280, partial [Aptenodytes forsteri]
DQTWVCVGPSCSSELAPGQTPGCGDAVPAEREGLCWGWAVGHCMGVTTPCITLTPCLCQSAGDQLSQELKCVKNELKSDKTAQCEAYRQTISSLQAQLRAA